ncbi:hypothetical protein [Nocardioides sp.]|nr:hypothetical protein [Nocardioides sp.]
MRAVHQLAPDCGHTQTLGSTTFVCIAPPHHRPGHHYYVNQDRR